MCNRAHQSRFPSIAGLNHKLRNHAVKNNAIVKPERAKVTKFATVIGASSGKSFASISPLLVLIRTFNTLSAAKALVMVIKNPKHNKAARDIFSPFPTENPKCFDDPDKKTSLEQI